MAVLAAAEVLDLTQDALAALVGCSKDLIVTIEGDARHPSRQVSEPLATPLQLAPRAGGFHPLPRAD